MSWLKTNTSLRVRENRIILNTDLYRVLPTHVPLAPECTRQGDAHSGYDQSFLPGCEQLVGVQAVGEQYIAHDDCSVIIPDHTEAPLISFRADQQLNWYMFGPGRYALPFAVKALDSGVWAEDAAALSTRLLRMKGDDAISCNVDFLGGEREHAIHGCRYPLQDPRYSSIYKCGLYRGSDSVVEELMARMERTPPPIRFTASPGIGVDASSLLYVTGAEACAELFMGWKGSNQGKGRRFLDQVVRGAMPVIQTLVEVSAREGNWHGIPANVPYGMTGGVQGMFIQPRVLRSFALSDWYRTHSARLWAHVCDRLNEDVIDQLFTERVLPWRATEAPQDREARRHRRTRGPQVGTYAIAPPSPGEDSGWNWHMIETGGLLVHHVKMLNNSTDFFPTVDNMPLAFVMVRGAMKLESPSGIALELKEGDVALKPAMAFGDFAVTVLGGSAEFFAITGVQRMNANEMVLKSMLEGYRDE